MKKIMLVCSAGMSTSLLVTKMEQAAEKVGDEVEIFALPMSDGINRLSTVDCVLLGPQVRFNLGKIKEEAAKVNPGLPVDVIDMKDYGMMNGAKVLDFALELGGNKMVTRLISATGDEIKEMSPDLDKEYAKTLA